MTGVQTCALPISDVKLPSGQTAYDRWGELHGQVKLGGMTMKDALRRLIKSPTYQHLTPESTPELDSPRIAEVNSVIQRYRSAAWAQLMHESTELNTYERVKVAASRVARAGGAIPPIPNPSR